MKSVLAIATAVLLAGTLGFPAQTQGPDFSGTWNLDADASDIPQGGGFGGGRGGGGRGAGGGRGGGRGGMGMGGGAAATVIITQTEAELAMEQQMGGQSRTITYQLDGSESANTGPRGNITTTTRWDGVTLVTEGAQQLSTPRGDFTLEFTERRTLSDDGSMMTVEATRTTPRGDIAAILVYRRATS